MSLVPAGSSDRWIPVARLLRPQGRRGELLSEALTDREGVFEPGRRLRLVPADAPAAQVTVVLEDCWRPQGRNAGRLVLKLAGVDSISAAEAWNGAELSLLAADLPPLEPGTFLVGDLLGCTLWDGEHAVGTVTDLQFPVGADGRTRLQDAVDLLVVEPRSTPASPHPAPGADASPDTQAPDSEGPEPVLVPFVKAWLQNVDLEAKRIHMILPPGLFD